MASFAALLACPQRIQQNLSGSRCAPHTLKRQCHSMHLISAPLLSCRWNYMYLTGISVVGDGAIRGKGAEVSGISLPVLCISSMSLLLSPMYSNISVCRCCLSNAILRINRSMRSLALSCAYGSDPTVLVILIAGLFHMSRSVKSFEHVSSFSCPFRSVVPDPDVILNR